MTLLIGFFCIIAGMYLFKKASELNNKSIKLLLRINAVILILFGIVILL